MLATAYAAYVTRRFLQISSWSKTRASCLAPGLNFLLQITTDVLDCMTCLVNFCRQVQRFQEQFV